jgi:hypothetical protein
MVTSLGNEGYQAFVDVDQVSPELSIAVKALSSVDATSSTHSWKNSIGTPLCPGAFTLGKAWMVPWISLNVRFLVRFAFVSFVTLTGTLVQNSLEEK